MYCLRLKLENFQRGYLQVTELTNAEKAIIRATQKADFTEEIHDLELEKRVNKKSKLVTLDPSIDRDGVIRVGGRLKNSTIPHSQQHLMLLPHSNHVTELII